MPVNEYTHAILGRMPVVNEYTHLTDVESANPHPLHALRDQDPAAFVAALGCGTVLCGVGIALSLVLAITLAEIIVGAKNYALPCDTPLALWNIVEGASILTVPILILNFDLASLASGDMVTFASRLFRTGKLVYCLACLVIIFSAGWFVVGVYWLYTSKTCEYTAPFLKTFTNVVIVGSYRVVDPLLTIAVCMFYMLRVVLLLGANRN